MSALAIIAGSASAATVTTSWYSSSVGSGSAGWSNSVTLPKFDSHLGTLIGVKFMLKGYVSGNAKFENQSVIPATVNMDLAATLKLTRPAPLSTVLVEAIPVANTTDNVTAYDGTIDFSGPGGSQTTGSGRTYANLHSDKTEYYVTTDPSDLSLFQTAIPGQTIVLPVLSYASSNYGGLQTGDIMVSFSTNAAADAAVQYTYDAVPEPSGIMALLTGACGLAGMAIRRKRA